jgi:hypothetical protein
MLPPSAIAGVSLLCAAATWLSVNVQVLRALAAAAAVATLVCAVVMRNWDRVAGKRVADLRRARESDAWAHEERVAELEGDLEESRAIRAKLEQSLRQKRTELAGLRNEHAALLRRYATAETERASALEGRRRLAIEAAPAARATPPAPAAPQRPVSPWQAALASSAASSRQVPTAQRPAAQEPETQARPAAGPSGAQAAETVESGVVRSGVAPYEDAPFGAAPVGSGAHEARQPGGAPSGSGADEEQRSPAVGRALPPAASIPTPALFRRANAALNALGRTGTPGTDAAERADDGTRPADDEHEDAAPRVPPQEPAPRPSGPAPRPGGVPPRPGGGLAAARPGVVAQRPGLGVPPSAVAAQRRAPGGGAQRAEAGAEHAEQSAGRPPAPGRYPATPAAATAVPPAAPIRPAPKGGFDFFGNHSTAPAVPPADSPSLLDAVRNEDLADVVGDEALALHKAEAEAGFKPAGTVEAGTGQIIDLTAHDETEQIDVSGLRNAVS